MNPTPNKSVAGNAIARMVIEHLTDQELLSLTIAIELGEDVRGANGYETAKSLFTKNVDGSVNVHDIVKDEFRRAVANLQAGKRSRAV